MVQIKRTCRHFQLFQSLKSSLLRNFYLPKFAHFEKQILFLEHPVMYSLLSRYISCHTCLNKRNSKSFRKFLELRVAFTKFRHFYLTKIQKIWKKIFVFFWTPCMGFRAFLILFLAELIKWKKSQSISTFWEFREALTKWSFFCNFYPFSMYFGTSGCQIFRKCAGLDHIFFSTFF